MKRVMETKKAEKLKQNLHLIDFPKMNKQVRFVSNYEQIVKATKGDDSMDEELVEESSVSKVNVRVNTEKLKQEVKLAQAQNKQQYKRLADAMGKSDSYGKV